jgi:hypothetical protein
MRIRLFLGKSVVSQNAEAWRSLAILAEKCQLTSSFFQEAIEGHDNHPQNKLLIRFALF